MRNLKNLDIEKSIQIKKLVIEENWLDKFDIFVNYLTFSVLIFSSFLVIKDINPNSPNDTVGYFIIPLIIVFSSYAIFCKFSEKKLKVINFKIHREEAKQRILEYGKQNNYRVSKISNDLIVLNRSTNDYGLGNQERTICIFFTDDEILYTLIRDGFRLNFPVLFSQHFVRADFKKILKLKIK